MKPTLHQRLTYRRILLVSVTAGVVVWLLTPAQHPRKPVTPCTQTWYSPAGAEHDIQFPVERNADGSCP